MLVLSHAFLTTFWPLLPSNCESSLHYLADGPKAALAIRALGWDPNPINNTATFILTPRGLQQHRPLPVSSLFLVFSSSSFCCYIGSLRERERGMKGPPPPGPEKPPSVAQKLKLLCSFGGAFAARHPSGELRYVDGETRIISLDRRGINLLNLLSRVSELHPGRLFSLKYQLPGASSSSGPPLVAITTDDD